MTVAIYDIFGRITSLTRPGDASETLSMSYTNAFPFTTTITQRVDDLTTYTVKRVYDGLGRQTQIDSGGAIVDTIYDSATVTRQSMPHLAGEAVFYTTTTQDINARTVKVEAPDLTYTLTTTDGLTTSVRDERGYITTTIKDKWGRVVSVTPPTGPGVSYTYDEMDRLIYAFRGEAAARDARKSNPAGCPASMTTALTYDYAGRKKTMADPDMGYWTYGYDAPGNLTSQTDARGCTLTMNYDDLNRLDTKTSSGSCGQQISADYDYDDVTNGNKGIGRRTSMSSGSVTSSWTYDERGRVLSETSMGYTTGYSYNSADLPRTMTYPDGEKVTYDYNSSMLLEKLFNDQGTPLEPADDYLYASAIGYDAAGRVRTRALGNGLTQGFDYYAWDEKATVDSVLTGQGGRLKLLSAGTLQNLGYLYDATGNIRIITDALGSETQAFGYDDLNRLTSASATGGPAPYSEGYIYDATTGNLQSKSGQTYTYLTNHPHAVSAFNGNTYGYDANGNQIQRVIGTDTFDLAYDAENRLVEVRKNSVVMASFVYNGDGQRVQSMIAGGTTTFVGNYYEVSDGAAIKYYYAGAARIAMRTGTSLYYLLGDHLGSTSLTTDSNGNVVSELRYGAWGETRYASSVTPTAYRYTGQREEPSFGLYFYQARWYDPYITHFTQADSIIPGAGDPQAWDRFAYALNNPTKFVDPSGHAPCAGLSDYACRVRTQKRLYAEGPDWTALANAGYSDWEIGSLKMLYYGGGTSAIHGVNYIIEQGIHITVGISWQSWGGTRGGWFGEGLVVLNADLKNSDGSPVYSMNSIPDAWGLSLIIHEAKHLEQGADASHSKLGEMDAWQIQFEVLDHLGYPLDQSDRDIMGAGSLEKYARLIQEYYPAYWKKNGVGLYTYPDYPNICLSLTSCGTMAPWWLRLNFP